MSSRFIQSNYELKLANLETPVGPMVAIADDTSLYLLEFYTKKRLEKELDRLQKKGFVIRPGNNAPLESITAELQAYFAGVLTQFKTGYRLFGTAFQQQVWQTLQQIPYGTTYSYAYQAQSLGKPTAYRAVANANGANQLSIIIPCHRVIASNGTLGGYGGGLTIKQSLLQLEKRYSESK